MSYVFYCNSCVEPVNGPQPRCRNCGSLRINFAFQDENGKDQCGRLEHLFDAVEHGVVPWEELTPIVPDHLFDPFHERESQENADEYQDQVLHSADIYQQGSANARGNEILNPSQALRQSRSTGSQANTAVVTAPVRGVAASAHQSQTQQEYPHIAPARLPATQAAGVSPSSAPRGLSNVGTAESGSQYFNPHTDVAAIRSSCSDIVEPHSSPVPESGHGAAKGVPKFPMTECTEENPNVYPFDCYSWEKNLPGEVRVKKWPAGTQCQVCHAEHPTQLHGKHRLYLQYWNEKSTLPYGIIYRCDYCDSTDHETVDHGKGKWYDTEWSLTELDWPQELEEFQFPSDLHARHRALPHHYYLPDSYPDLPDPRWGPWEHVDRMDLPFKYGLWHFNECKADWNIKESLAEVLEMNTKPHYTTANPKLPPHPDNPRVSSLHAAVKSKRGTSTEGMKKENTEETRAQDENYPDVAAFRYMNTSFKELRKSSQLANPITDLVTGTWFNDQFVLQMTPFIDQSSADVAYLKDLREEFDRHKASKDSDRLQKMRSIIKDAWSVYEAYLPHWQPGTTHRLSAEFLVRRRHKGVEREIHMISQERAKHHREG